MDAETILDVFHKFSTCSTLIGAEWVDRMSSRKPNNGDRLKAAELKALRLAAGLTQVQAGELLGVSQQQYAKNERGQDRISASRFDEAKRLFRPKDGTRGGLSEAGMGYLVGPGTFLSGDRETLIRKWEEFKRAMDAFLVSLPAEPQR